MKTTTNIIYSAFALFAFACFAILPSAQAVSPPPDGGYPGGNTAEGTNALLSLTTGQNNTAVGVNSLSSTTIGNQNTAIGAGALRFNTTGVDNTAHGFHALLNNTTGKGNTAIGSFALINNTTANGNTAIGDGALSHNTVGVLNTAIGFGALLSNTGLANTAIGSTVLVANTTGFDNTAIGAFAMNQNTIGNANTAIGDGALHDNTTGIANTAIGHAALLNNTTGRGNIALGISAGYNLTRGNSNIDIGNEGMAGETNTIRIGTVETQTATFIAGIHGVAVTGTAVVVSGSGQLGVAPSSERFKEAIKPMDKASEAILALKPVTFRYKKEIDTQRTPQFGLVAEEVEKVNRALVAYDDHGKPYTVRYEAVNAMLLNEFLKEHTKVEKLEATVAKQQKDFRAASAQQQKEIQALAAGLKEQASQIQKINAQVEVYQSAPKTVLNNR